MAALCKDGRDRCLRGVKALVTKPVRQLGDQSFVRLGLGQALDGRIQDRYRKRLAGIVLADVGLGERLGDRPGDRLGNRRRDWLGNGSEADFR